MADGKTTVSILIADDDPGDCQLIEKALQENHLPNPRFFVNNGRELLDFLFNRGKYSDTTQYPKPDIIFLDLNMPEVDGQEVLKELKSNPQLKATPIIVMTHSTAEEDIAQVYDLGVNCVVRKPLTFEGLVDVIQKLSYFWFTIAILPR